MAEHSKIAIIIGTKAELIKTFPLMLELQKQKKDYWFISTGQHPLSQISAELKVKKPDFVLSKEPKINTKFWSRINKSSVFWSFGMISKVKKLLRKLKPRYVIYHGDTMSTAIASIASSKFLNRNKSWKNVHLEAGLRSGSLLEPFPEEISRRISDKFSDILLAVSNLSQGNLKRIYKDKKEIIKIGNTIVDSAHIIYQNYNKKGKKEKGNYVLINIHRHENIVNKNNLKKIVEIINSIKTRGIWPLHENTRMHLEKFKLLDKIDKNKILITPLKSYEEFIFLLSNCKYIICDGGSIQEESLVFRKPCIILRNYTERQEGLSTGINFLTKLDVDYSRKIIEKLEDKKFSVPKFKNPYGKPGISKKIINEVLK